MVGEGTPPPNVLNWPKPASSIRISTTFGAPCGACTGCGNCGGSESRYVRPTFPGKWKSGRGSTLGVEDGGVSALGFSWARPGCTNGPSPRALAYSRILWYWLATFWRSAETQG